MRIDRARIDGQAQDLLVESHIQKRTINTQLTASERCRLPYRNKNKTKTLRRIAYRTNIEHHLFMHRRSSVMFTIILRSAAEIVALSLFVGMIGLWAGIASGI